jgi:predicted O-linked N-acetylglucosamine transferase (SPINDLY family)
MAGSGYAAWMQRGLAHQSEQRPIDAMLCFQRAAALAPSTVDPRYRIGEVQWQLGLPGAAVNAWREATRIAPAHPASHLALAEALLTLGDSQGASTAAATGLALAPDDRAARVLNAVVSVATGRDPRALEGLAPLLRADASLLASPAIGGALARSLLQTPERAGAVDWLVALVPHREHAAFALLAPMAAAALEASAPRALREAVSEIADTALSRPVTADDVDTLRQIAYVHFASGDRETATRLAARYAEACIALTSHAAPSRWPLRTAGRALRVAVVLPPASTHQAIALLREADNGRVAWTLIVNDALDGTVPESLAGAAVRSLASASPPTLAAAVASDDPDLLIDMAGLGLATGPLLALRPAERIVAAPVGEPAHCAPLIDEVVDADSRSFAALIEREASRAATRRTSSLDAASLNATFARAVEAHRSGDVEAARASYATVLEAQPDHAPTLHLFAALHRETNALEQAAALLEKAVQVAPAFADARAAAARLARDRGDFEHGLALVEDGLRYQPRSKDLWRVRGEVELARHDMVAAQASFANALALAPTDAEAHYNIGVALQKQGRDTEAARAYQRALAFDPDLAEAHHNLGVLFQQGGHLNASIDAYRAVLARDSAHVGAYKHLGEALLAAGRIDEWLASFARFEASCPNALPLAVQALEACQYAADLVGLERYLDGLRHERFRARDAFELVDALEQLLYLLLFFDVEPEMLYRFAQTYTATAPRVYGAPLPRRDERKPGKLRIGYLSADLRNHVMGKMAWQALQHHDRGRFALHFYSLSRSRDAWTARFAGIADRFEVVAGLSEREAAQRIAEDDLDLLVDLSGHTKGAKPGILALKPARVQITHVASAGSVGLDSVDFKLTDAFADVPASQASMIETLLPMQGCVYPYRRIEPAPDHPFHRSALGIDATAIVIGAFVTPMKLSRRCLALWRDVLDRIPNARIAFSPTHPALRPVFERLAASAGIRRDRLLFIPQGRDDAESQARYALVDFVLDPMPFGGVNGVLEPLDAGVPVVTLRGQRHGERSAYSILANLGVTQTVADSGRDYVDLAVRLAEDAAFAQAVRAAIRAGLRSSTLVDLPLHARNLEAAYVEALRQRAPEVLEAAARD